MVASLLRCFAAPLTGDPEINIKTSRAAEQRAGGKEQGVPECPLYTFKFKSSGKKGEKEMATFISECGHY
jgi:hypothetical protein